MKYIYYLMAIVGFVFLLNDTYFGFVYFKIVGLILTMFCIYKIQSKVPSKSEKIDDTNSKNEAHDV